MAGVEDFPETQWLREEFTQLPGMGRTAGHREIDQVGVGGTG